MCKWSRVSLAKKVDERRTNRWLRGVDKETTAEERSSIGWRDLCAGLSQKVKKKLLFIGYWEPEFKLRFSATNPDKIDRTSRWLPCTARGRGKSSDFQLPESFCIFQLFLRKFSNWITTLRIALSTWRVRITCQLLNCLAQTPNMVASVSAFCRKKRKRTKKLEIPRQNDRNL